MATVIREPKMPASRRKLTVADLAALPGDLPSGPVKYELDRGRLVTLMAPPGGTHGSNQATIIYLLKLHGERAGHGKTFGEVAVILRQRPDTVLAPDAAFVAKRSLPVRYSPEGYLETIPELVVEIRSKNDTRAELRAKAAEYLDAGVKIVWLVDPSSKTVTVCTANKNAQEMRVGDTLMAKGVIPGFQVPVAELFGG